MLIYLLLHRKGEKELGLVAWVRDFMSGEVVANVPVTDEAFFNIVAETHIRELAFWSSVNMIANSISKCEFKTFENNQEVKGREHYLWNIEPNKNQNSSVFLRKLITKLYKNNECLVIQENDQLLVVDHFSKREFALRENLFEGVTVGEFTFNRTFAMSEVLYFKLSERDMGKVINALYESYGKLIAYGMKCYKKSRGTKGIFQYDTLPVAGTEERKAFDSLIGEKFKKFIDSGDAILPLGKGQAYEDIGSKTYSKESTRDIRAMIDDVADFTAKAFCIPPVLAKGDIAGIKDAMESYLTFCIDPLADMLQEEINRKRNGYEGFSKGNYLKIDSKCILHVDLLSVSSAIDKLIASGAFCINDIRKLVGETMIDEEWANKHFITKNYSDIELALEALKGGEKA